MRSNIEREGTLWVWGKMRLRGWSTLMKKNNEALRDAYQTSLGEDHLWKEKRQSGLIGPLLLTLLTLRLRALPFCRFGGALWHEGGGGRTSGVVRRSNRRGRQEGRVLG